MASPANSTREQSRGVPPAVRRLSAGMLAFERRSSYFWRFHSDQARGRVARGHTVRASHGCSVGRSPLAFRTLLAESHLRRDAVAPRPPSRPACTGSSPSPDSRNTFVPSGRATTASRCNRPSTTSANAPIGTWQPPPIWFSKARSQVVVARAADHPEKATCRRTAGIILREFQPPARPVLRPDTSASQAAPAVCSPACPVDSARRRPESRHRTRRPRVCADACPHFRAEDESPDQAATPSTAPAAASCWFQPGPGSAVLRYCCISASRKHLAHLHA